MARAFLAIGLPDQIVEEFFRYQKRLRGSLPGVRVGWNRNPHITLQFLGELEEKREQEILDSVSSHVLSVASKASPFEIGLSGIGSFPPGQDARVLWIGVQGGGALQRLYYDLDRSFELLDLPAEAGRKQQTYHPHLTLGRVKPSGVRVTEQIPPFISDPFMVDRIGLYKSRLLPTGAEHRLIEDFSLSG